MTAILMFHQHHGGALRDREREGLGAIGRLTDDA